MPIAGGGAKVEIDFESRVDELIADTKRVIQSQEKLKQQTKETNEVIRRSAKEAEDAAKRQTMSWTDFRSMYSTVLDVVRVGQAVWAETGQKYVDNAVTVGNLARAMGTTTEEASRLKEVADDVNISVDSLKTSMKIALKDGFEPNIDGLARMSDEYLKLAPGTERMQYLFDRFGKSGEEMGKLLEKGGKSIRNMSAAMDEGLLVTEEAYKQSLQYKASVDALRDSWDALTYKAAPPLVEGMTDITNQYRDNIRAVELAKEAGMTWGAYMGSPFIQEFKKAAAAEREQADAALLAAEAAQEAGGAFESEAETAARLADEAKIAEQAIKDITKANQDFLKLTDDLTKSQESYKEKMSDLTTQHEELLAEKQTLIDQGYSVEGQAILDVNAKIDENMAKQDEATTAFELDGRRRILSMLEQQLAVGGLSTAETAYLLDLGLQWGVYSEEAVNAANAAQTEVNNFVAAFNAIPTEKDVTIRVATIQSTYAADNGAGFDAAHPNGHATGGEFMIPQSYGNEGFRMGNNDTASGGEMVKITPKGQSHNDNSPQNTTAVISDASMDKFIARIETALQRAGK